MRIPRSKGPLACLILASTIAATAPWAFAHSGATGVTKERMDAMKGMAESMKIMGAMFKGETAFDPSVVAEKAGFLARHATEIPEMTPEGSNDHPSEALPVIWEAWDDYIADARSLEQESARLLQLAKDGADQTAAREQYVRLGRTCGTCHDRFRKPKD